MLFNIRKYQSRWSIYVTKFYVVKIFREIGLQNQGDVHIKKDRFPIFQGDCEKCRGLRPKIRATPYTLYC
jgi:hypothetical protein